MNAHYIAYPDNNWHDFIQYMLEGFYTQAKDTHSDLKKITSLFGELKEKIRKENKKLHRLDLIEALFTYPIITPTKLAAELSIHYTTASRHLNELVKMGILKEARVGKYHLFANQELLDILSI